MQACGDMHIANFVVFASAERNLIFGIKVFLFKCWPAGSGRTVKIENTPAYCSLSAWALALAHAKSGDAAVIAGYAGNSDELDEALVRFAFSYGAQNEKDFKALEAAAKTGRIKVVPEQAK